MQRANTPRQSAGAFRTVNAASSHSARAMRSRMPAAAAVSVETIADVVSMDFAPPPSHTSSSSSSHATRARAPSHSQDFSVQFEDISKSVLGIILGGGAGSRLYPLTKKRAKPAVPLGANYRLIDIPVSNCINSGINKVYCLTQFNSASLNRHISSAYNATVGGLRSDGFVEVLAASQTVRSKDWFQGTADAVRQYMWLLESKIDEGVEDFIILAGDHLYKCNYQEFIHVHRMNGADITVAALPCDETRASAFGLMKIDDEGRITEFAEKPKGDALKAMQVDTTILGLDADRAAQQPYIASMGIYVLKATALKRLLMESFPTALDFGSEVIPGAVSEGARVQAYLYDGYWEDIGTISAFFNANLAINDPDAPFSFYDDDSGIFTQTRFLPPSKILDACVERTTIGDGSVIEGGCTLKNTVLGVRTIVRNNATLEDVLVMGCDYYELPDECELLPHCIPMGVGASSVIRRAIIDKNARIGANVQLVNKAGVVEADLEAQGIIIKEGIICVIKDTIVPSGFVL